MNRIAYALAGLGLLASAARADEKVEMKKDKNEVKVETKIEDKTRVNGNIRAREVRVLDRRPSRRPLFR